MFFSGTTPDYFVTLATLPANTQARAAKNWKDWQKLTQSEARKAATPEQLREQFSQFASRIGLLPLLCSKSIGVYGSVIDSNHRSLAARCEDNSGKPRLIWFWAGRKLEFERLTDESRKRSLQLTAQSAIEKHRVAHRHWYATHRTNAVTPMRRETIVPPTLIIPAH